MDTDLDTDKSHRNSVGSWHDKQEFLNVYNWLYSNTSPIELQKAYNRLIVWRQRRGNLTSASILATIVILEVMLHDTQENAPPLQDNVIVAMYSCAFTRFLNYMSSVMQSRNLKTMYMTAKELGLNSAVVDLRHLCAHGQTMPSLDIFRRSSKYLLKWIKEYYWDCMALQMKNVYFEEIQTTNVPQSAIGSLFALMNVYDVISFGVYQGYATIQDYTFTDDVERAIIENYAGSIGEQQLIKIQKQCVGELNQNFSHMKASKGVGKMLKKAFFENCKHFLEVGAKFYPNQPFTSRLLRVHQDLIKNIAKCGLLHSLIEALFDIAEKSDQDWTQNKGAAFWLIKILAAFHLAHRTHITQFPKVEELIHSQKRTSEILSFNDFKKLKIKITNEGLMNRVLNINDFTSDAVKLYLLSAERLLLPAQYEQLWTIVQTYTTDNFKTHKKVKLDLPAFRLQEDVLKTDKVVTNADITSKYGIWSEGSSTVNWSAIPLGAIIN